jgi:hypothetical protein
VKNVKTTSFTQSFSPSFTLWQMHVPESKGKENPRRKQCPAEKDPNRAGATPLFGLSAAQKYLGSLPPWAPFAVPRFFPPGIESFGDRNVKEKANVHHQEGTCNSYPRI